MKPKVVAELAALVGETAEAGDAVATRLVDVGAAELAGSAFSVARRLGLLDLDLPLPLAGGVFSAVPIVRTRVIERLARLLPHARPALLSEEPASGALSLATALLRGDVHIPVYLETTH